MQVECKEVDDWILNPSTGDFGCNKAYKIDEC